jgi:hypothetical protein
VFYWPSGYRPVHASMIEAAHLASLPQLPDNPAATAVVKRARQRVMEIVASFGGGHFQLGRAYPYRESRDAASQALLDTIKGFVDQDGQLNPGGLGFPQ